MQKYRVRRKVLQSSALSLPRRGFYATIGKRKQIFGNEEPHKVSEWAENVWDEIGIETPNPCRVYVVTMSGQKVIYASYTPVGILPKEDTHE